MRGVFLVTMFVLVLAVFAGARDTGVRVVEKYNVSPGFSRTTVGIMTSWPYPISYEGFGVGIVFDGGGYDYSLWISDFSTNYGLYEIYPDGTQGSGYIMTTDLDATDDLGYFESQDGFIVGDYAANAIETYTTTGGFEASLAGPPAWDSNLIFGVAFNNDDSIVYVSDTEGRIAYATMTDLTSALSWNDLGEVLPGTSLPGLGYNEDDYLFVCAREATGAKIYVYATTAGVPDTSAPAFEYDLSGVLSTDINGCEWDGDYLWVYGREDDYMYKLALDGISPDTGITPKSLGGIKAGFR